MMYSFSDKTRGNDVRYKGTFDGATFEFFPCSMRSVKGKTGIRITLKEIEARLEDCANSNFALHSIASEKFEQCFFQWLAKLPNLTFEQISRTLYPAKWKFKPHGLYDEEPVSQKPVDLEKGIPEKFKPMWYKIQYRKFVEHCYSTMLENKPLAADSICRVLNELHRKAFGDYFKSWIEKKN